MVLLVLMVWGLHVPSSQTAADTEDLWGCDQAAPIHDSVCQEVCDFLLCFSCNSVCFGLWIQEGFKKRPLPFLYRAYEVSFCFKSDFQRALYSEMHVSTDCFFSSVVPKRYTPQMTTVIVTTIIASITVTIVLPGGSRQREGGGFYCYSLLCEWLISHCQSRSKYLLLSLGRDLIWLRTSLGVPDQAYLGGGVVLYADCSKCLLPDPPSCAPNEMPQGGISETHLLLIKNL